MKSLGQNRPSIGTGITLALALLLNACGSGGSGPITRVLTRIEITPPSEIMTVGTTAVLRATGTYSDGTTADISTSVTWASASPATASIGTSTGIVTASATGSANISASMSSGDALGTTVSAGAVVTVTSLTLNSITVSPATNSVTVGSSTTPFSAIGTFSDGVTSGNISGAVNWSSGDPTVATVDTKGVATGVAAGSCQINATFGLITGSASLQVF